MISSPFGELFKRGSRGKKKRKKGGGEIRKGRIRRYSGQKKMIFGSFSNWAWEVFK